MFQKRFIDKYKKLGYLVIKTIRLSENGYPDIILLKDGVASFVELKQGSDTLKPLQKFRIDELRKCGFAAWCEHEKKGKIY